MTLQEKQARAEYFGNWSTEYQRIANAASMTGMRQVAATYEIAAAVAGLLEQAYKPSIGQVITETLIYDRAVQAVSEQSGIPRLVVEEVANTYLKPKLQVVSEAMDRAAGLK